MFIHADAQALALIPSPRSGVTFTPLNHSELSTEWEWDNDPECSLVVVEDVQQAIELFNKNAPRFIVSVISDDANELRQVWLEADAPFVGNGMTRWVDGQFALNKPELGLSNWQSGRILGRGGILSGDSVFSLRYLVDQRDEDLHR